MPNLIGLLEKPDTTRVVGVFSERTKQVWDALTAAGPDHIEYEGILLHDVNDASTVASLAAALVQESSGEWTVNATGGTKMMVAPAIDVFRRSGHGVFYVDTARSALIEYDEDWSTTEVPFFRDQDLSIGMFMAAHGARFQRSVAEHTASNLERQIATNLSVGLPTCSSLSGLELFDAHGDVVSELDVVAVYRYRLLHFEVKRTKGSGSKTPFQSYLDDFHKLFRVRQLIGGPVAKSFFVKTGDDIRDLVRVRRLLEMYQITFIPGNEISSLAQPDAARNVLAF